MNTTAEVEALPADVVALAEEADLGPHTLTCLPKRLGGIVGVLLALVGIPLTVVVTLEIGTAVARGAYGAELVLHAVLTLILLYVNVQILNPQNRRLRFYDFARGYILRDRRGQLTHVRWADIIRVRRLRTVNHAHWWELSATGERAEVHPSLYRRSYEVDTYVERGARGRGLKIEYR